MTRPLPGKGVIGRHGPLPMSSTAHPHTVTEKGEPKVLTVCPHTVEAAKPAVPSGQLPDGAVYYARYDALARRWRGDLTLPGGGCFCAEAATATMLLMLLDKQYREARKRTEERS
jgi:hypothetical protein